MIELFISVFGKEKIGVLLADREFIGDPWLKWLKQEEISYCIRIKEAGQYISNSKGEMVMAADLLHHLKPGETISLGARRLGKASNSKHHLSASRQPKTGELLVVVHSGNLNEPCQLYKYRWQIETMFKAFKSSGFNLEDTRVTSYERLETLIAVMTIAFTISYEIGDAYEADHPQKLKKHGYKAVSTYRIGINLIKNWIFNGVWILMQIIKEIMSRIILVDTRVYRLGRKNVL